MAPVQRKGLRALQLWCVKVTADYPNVCITDLSSSFSDGLAFNAIIHHFRPHLFNYYSLKPNAAFENNAHAFKVAEEQLQIPSLLDPEDMEDPDKLSVATYLQQFYHAFKSEDKSTTSSPNISLNRKSSESSTETDSIVQSSSSEGSESSEGTPAATPITTRTARIFNRSDLIEKYGEDIFSNGKNEDDGNKVERKSKPWTRQDTKAKNESTESTTRAKTNSPKSVASMCKQFELNTKISAS